MVYAILDSENIKENAIELPYSTGMHRVHEKMFVWKKIVSVSKNMKNVSIAI